MKKKRIAIALALFMWVVAMLGLLVYWINTPENVCLTLVIGVRTDARGDVIQRLIQEERYRKKRLEFGPRVGRLTRYSHYRYFLEEAGKERRELKYLHDVEECWPIEGTSRWLAVKGGPGNRVDRDDAYLFVVVFDETQFIRRQKLQLQWSFEEEPYALRNGNRTVVYREHGGVLKGYDVLKGTDEPWTSCP
jgi:hypothetical protein